MDLSILYFKGSQVKFLIDDFFLFLKTVLILANSADPDEMPPDTAFHLGLHCLLKYLFTVIQIEKGLDTYKQDYIMIHNSFQLQDLVLLPPLLMRQPS